MGKNKIIYFLTLSILTGILLWISWPPKYLTILIFIAFVPLLLLEDLLLKHNIKKSALKLFLYSYLAFLIWNLLTTYWVYKASLSGAVMAIILNTLLMTIPIMLFHKIKVLFRSSSSYIYLIAFWITFEYIHLRWDFAWPWLNLGNIFAQRPEWVQWYEFTGVFGGTTWIWLVNILVFLTLKKFLKILSDSGSYLRIIPNSLIIIVVILIPILISKTIKIPESKSLNKNVVIVQPNIDPYTLKFSMPIELQIQKLITLSEKAIDSNTILLVWPETAISKNIDEDFINHSPVIGWIRMFLIRFPNLKLISGIDSYKFFQEGETPSSTAREASDGNFYDRYNAAILLDKSKEFSIYHKSKLVPGVEKMPYPKFFKFLNKLVIDLGGTSGSLGKQPEASVFKINDELIAAPIICYESIFGDYTGDFIRKGASIITIVTNDGWWGFTDGFKQHYLYAVLRAIEFRKDIIRSANTGISCYINSKGEILEKTEYWVDDVIKHNISLNNKTTFYARSGDYLGRIAMFVSIMMILVSIVKSFTRKSMLENNY